MDKEIIFNLWYITDESHMMYSLKAKPYVHSGSDENKTSFLKERSALDYDVARDFYLPDRFHTIFPQGSMNVFPVSVLNESNGIFEVYENVFDTFEKEISVFSNLKLSPSPLYVITALYLDSDRKIQLFKK